MGATKAVGRLRKPLSSEGVLAFVTLSMSEAEPQAFPVPQVWLQIGFTSRAPEHPAVLLAFTSALNCSCFK